MVSSIKTGTAFAMDTFFDLSFTVAYCAEIRIYFEIREPLELCLKFWTEKISPRHVDRRNVFSTSTKVDDLSNKLDHRSLEN